MSYTRKTLDLPLEREYAAIAAANDTIDALVSQGVIVHHQPDVAHLITTPDASALDSSKALAMALALAIPLHGADAKAHVAADVIAQAAAWTSAPALPADLTEVQNILNELKTDLNTHVAASAPHRNVWGTPGVNGAITAKAITTANASDQGTANALANALKAFLNAHIKAGAASIELVKS